MCSGSSHAVCRLDRSARGDPARAVRADDKDALSFGNLDPGDAGMEEACLVAPESRPLRFVACAIRRPGDTVTLSAPVQFLACRMGVDGCRTRRLSSARTGVPRRNAKRAASSTSVRTAERGFFGPVLRSSTVRGPRPFPTVRGLVAGSRLGVSDDACDHSGEAVGPKAGRPSDLQPRRGVSMALPR